LIGDSGNNSIDDDFDENSHPGIPPRIVEDQEMVNIRRDEIAQAMWDDYQRVCQERGINMDEPIVTDDDELDFDEDDVQ
jgi:hypothetical protein